MNRSIIDINGEVLIISQFTLHALTRKGNRPSYIRAAGHEKAVPLYEHFCKKVSEKTTSDVKKGIFAADMKVALVNDGPVTILIDSKNKE
jgi:D-tyrosyl-tRNA(Tyr) deacylase